jgi:hypothetical protein
VPQSETQNTPRQVPKREYIIEACKWFAEGLGDFVPSHYIPHVLDVMAEAPAR